MTASQPTLLTVDAPPESLSALGLRLLSGERPGVATDAAGSRLVLPQARA
jgi:hypothetical protein